MVTLSTHVIGYFYLSTSKAKHLSNQFCCAVKFVLLGKHSVFEAGSIEQC